MAVMAMMMAMIVAMMGPAITFLYVVIVLVVVFLAHRGDAMHSHV